ncbi:MAG: pyrroline-5-carboxylate reductase [Deltaproteobacteria bacterium]|nr:pyrroline-5-carboxylate reductase [Deltaproteobacteria bacterium]
MNRRKPVALIGGGNMGEVLIRALTESSGIRGADIRVSDISPGRRSHLSSRYGVTATSSNGEAADGAGMVILAVKPQIMKEVLQGLTKTINREQLIVSIAAGIPTAFIEGLLAPGVPVVRAMPNTPALIGEGATALCKGIHASQEDLIAARTLFDALGTTVIVEEILMDAVTGLSGSGPAYAFLIIESLTDAGVLLGIPRETALRLSAQTLLGAAKLCLAGDKTPAQLKEMVTSPGGTTIAGIKALEEGKLRATLMSAVEAATRRSGELAHPDASANHRTR